MYLSTLTGCASLKSRVMGDYQARFRERLGGAIPPCLLDFYSFNILNVVNCSSILIVKK